MDTNLQRVQIRVRLNITNLLNTILVSSPISSYHSIVDSVLVCQLNNLCFLLYVSIYKEKTPSGAANIPLHLCLVIKKEGV